MFFTFPEDGRWNAERQAVEFGVEIGEYQGMVRVPRRVFQRLLTESPTPERRLEAYYLQRTRFETISERKLRQRQLTDDGNVEITGRNFRKGAAAQPSKFAGAAIGGFRATSECAATEKKRSLDRVAVTKRMPQIAITGPGYFTTAQAIRAPPPPRGAGVSE